MTRWPHHQEDPLDGARQEEEDPQEEEDHQEAEEDCQEGQQELDNQPPKTQM